MPQDPQCLIDCEKEAQQRIKDAWELLESGKITLDDFWRIMSDIQAQLNACKAACPNVP